MNPLRTGIPPSTATNFIVLLLACSVIISCSKTSETSTKTPTFKLVPGDTFYFNSFVDCNMAEAWVGDTFRIFPGKYGEDPVWGYARDLKFADGANADQAFSRKAAEFTEPALPVNAKIGQPGLHGAVWFETVYQDAADKTGRTLFAVYHNENYPATLPYDSVSRTGYY